MLDSKLVSGSDDCEVRIWEPNGLVRARFIADDQITALAVMQAGTIAVGDAAGRVYRLELVES